MTESTLFQHSTALAKQLIKLPLRNELILALHHVGYSTTARDPLTSDHRPPMRRNPFVAQLVRGRDQFRTLANLNTLLKSETVRSRLSDRRIDLDPLDPDLERQFVAGNALLEGVAEALWNKLGQGWKELDGLATPYSERLARSGETVSTSPEYDDSLASLATAFAQFVPERPMLPRGLERAGVAAGILRMEQELYALDARPDGNRADLMHGHQWTGTDPRRLVLLGLKSATRVKLVIRNVLQLLFQACLMDRLITLNEENVYSIERSSDRLGFGVTVGCQSGDAQMITMGPASLMFLSIKGEREVEGPGMVMSKDVNFGQHGTDLTLRIRMLDSSMNPFPQMLER